jgi:hypothetical protein
MTDLPIKFNNYEDCLMGVGQTYDDVVYVYDREKIIEKIMQELTCTYKDALSFFEKNVNKDFGKRSPVYFSKINDLINIQ